MLNCIAIYRGMDKKPYGNILKEPEITKLFGAASLKEGDSIVDILSKSSNPVDNLTDAYAGVTGLANGKGLVTSALEGIVSSINDIRPASTYMAKYSGQGKHLAPLPGDRHRITGLIQRKPVTYGRETLSQASRAIIIPDGRCNA